MNNREWAARILQDKQLAERVGTELFDVLVHNLNQATEEAYQAGRKDVRVQLLAKALLAERQWNEDQLDTLSKQGFPSAWRWHELQHRERLEVIDAALAEAGIK